MGGVVAPPADAVPTYDRDLTEETSAQAWADRFARPRASVELAERLRVAALEAGDEEEVVAALLVLARGAFYASDAELELRHAEEAVRRAEGLGGVLEARAWVGLAVARLDLERLDDVPEVLRTAEQRCAEAGHGPGLLEVEDGWAYLDIIRGNVAAARDRLVAAGDRHSSEDDADTARHEHLLCIAHSYLGDPEATAHHLQRALALSERCGDRRRAAVLRGLEASLHEDRGELAPALECYIGMLDGLRALERHGTPSGRFATDAFEHIVDIYVRLGDLDRARQHGLEALRHARSVRHTRSIASMLALLGRVHRLLGETGAATAMLHEAEATASRNGDEHVAARVLHELGLIALPSDPAAALEHLDAGGRLSAANGLTFDQAELALARSRALAALDRDGEAQVAVEEALGLAQAHGFRELEAEAHRGLAARHRDRGSFATALEHFEAFHRLDRELLAQRLDQRTHAARMGFDRERAEIAAQVERERSAELLALNSALQARGAENARLLAELQTQTGLLERQANRDPLTDLPNRRDLEARLEDELRRGDGRSQPLTVAMMDLDDFKAINDERSHALGDAVLQAVSRLFERLVRDGDVVARYGGEEFVLVLPGTTLGAARSICDRIRTAVAHHPWGELASGLVVTLSIGLADRDATDDLDELLDLADQKMYVAKRTGKNRVVA